MKQLLITLHLVLVFNLAYAQNKVGLGTTTPSERLDVIGNANISDTIKLKYVKIGINAGLGKVLTSDGNGNASWQTPSLSGLAWGLNGNASTNPSIHFLGTTDNQPLRFKINNRWFGTLSSKNIAFGDSAFVSNSGEYNVAIGNGALKNNTTGDYNVALGNLSLNRNTSGYSNTAIGSHALIANKSGYRNTAVGYNALSTNDSNIANTALGYEALYFASNGNQNTALGYFGLRNLIVGSGNIAIGNEALWRDTATDGQIAIGRASLSSSYNTIRSIAIGDSALSSVSNSYENIAIGYKAFRTAINNFFYTYQNVGLGNYVGENASTANSIAIGHSAFRNASNSGSIGIGNNVMHADSNGFYNIGIGEGVMAAARGGGHNIAMGYHAMYFGGKNTTPFFDGSQNICLGYEAGLNNGKGSNNVALGERALSGGYDFNTGLFVPNDGNDNVAIGHLALQNNSTGFDNIAIGQEVMRLNTTGYANIALGYKALGANKNGALNTAIGHYALQNDTVGYCTAVGYGVLSGVTNGNENTGIGYYALQNVSTGYRNQGVGYYAGYNLTSGSINIAVGGLTGPTSTLFGNINNSISIGEGIANNLSNQAALGNASTIATGGFTNWSNYSDARMKYNIKKDVHGLDFILKLNPVTYNRSIDKANAILGVKKMENPPADFYQAESIRWTGFIAQEVEQAAQEVGYDFSGVKPAKHENDLYSVSYAEFVVPLVKAIQEQQAIIEEMKKEIESLKRARN